MATVHMHVGQAGNEIGGAYWRLAAAERPPKRWFFDEHGRCRAVFVDTEPKVVRGVAKTLGAVRRTLAAMVVTILHFLRLHRQAVTEQVPASLTEQANLLTKCAHVPPLVLFQLRRRRRRRGCRLNAASFSGGCCTTTTADTTAAASILPQLSHLSCQSRTSSLYGVA